MFDEVSTQLNFVEREKEVEDFWRERRIFEKSIDERKEGETYTFYEMCIRDSSIGRGGS